MDNIIEAELFGRRVFFQERTARQALAFTQLVQPDDGNTDEIPEYITAVYANVKIIQDSALAYRNGVSKWNFIRRFWQQHLTDTNRMLKGMSPRELGELAIKILIECEGLDPLDDNISIKKKTENQ